MSVAFGTAHAVAAEARSGIYNFDIPAQKLNDALQALAFASQHKLLYSSKLVDGKESPPLKGEYTTEEAVGRLLAGTDLVYQITADGLVVIQEANAVANPVSSVGSAEGETIRVAQAETNSSESTESPTADETSLEEVVVTAQKRVERLQDVPVPVYVLQTESLATQSQLRLQDYFAKIPGLSLVVGGEGQAPMIAIRGLITAADQGSQTVGIVIDDVAYGHSVNPGTLPVVPDIDPGDVAQVEVLRGPQGTLYGANSIGGLVKYVSVEPSLGRFSGRLQAGGNTIENGDTGYNLRGAFNVPLSNTVAVRASGYYSEEPGFINNTLTGVDDINSGTAYGFRLVGKWQPSDDLSLKLGSFYQNRKRDGGSDIAVSSDRELNQSFVLGVGEYERETWALSANLAAKLGSVDVVAITGWNVDDFFANGDQSGLAGFFQINSAIIAPLDVKTEKFSQEIRGDIPLSDRLNLLLGAFYTEETMDLDLQWFGFVAPSGPQTSLLYHGVSPSRYREYAGFTDLTVSFTPKFDVQVGGRIGEIKQSVALTERGLGAALFRNGADPFVQPTTRVSETPITYLLTPRYRVSPDLMLYARIASGYRPGGGNLGCQAIDVSLCEFDADTTRNFELGTKGAILDGRLSFDASAFYIDWQDLHLFVRDIDRNFAYTANAGEARSQGLELSVSASPFNAFNVSGWITYLDASLAKDVPATAQIAGRKGDSLPFSSEISGSLAVEKVLTLSSELRVSLGGALVYVGDRKDSFQRVGTPRLEFPDYTQVDLHAGVARAGWRVDAYVNNVADKRGITRARFSRTASGQFEPRSLFLINPRMYGISVTREF
jgi:iron complex outermembrane recepter protein